MREQNILASICESPCQEEGLKVVELVYCRTKIKKLLKSKIEALNEALKPTAAYKKYDGMRAELCKIHAKKDKAGKPAVEMGRFVMNNQKAFEKAHDKLKVKYQKAVAARKQPDWDFMKLLEESVSMELHMVEFKNVPEDITVSS